jgi:hypothetical protein
MSKKLTIQDATKQELIEFMFAPAAMGGGFGIPVPQDSFILWLQKKRGKEYIDSAEDAAEASNKALKSYIELVRRANDEPDIDKKLALLEKGAKAFDQYKKYSKEYDKLSKKADEVWN